MAEHRIRLRGRWECHDLAVGTTTLLDLPAPSLLASGPHLRLVRGFQRPPLGPDECLLLHLQDVEGIVQVALNGKPMARPPRGTSELLLPLGSVLPARNVLTLEVELPPIRTENPWGTISLVIRPGSG